MAKRKSRAKTKGGEKKSKYEWSDCVDQLESDNISPSSLSTVCNSLVQFYHKHPDTPPDDLEHTIDLLQTHSLQSVDQVEGFVDMVCLFLSDRVWRDSVRKVLLNSTFVIRLLAQPQLKEYFEVVDYALRGMEEDTELEIERLFGVFQTVVYQINPADSLCSVTIQQVSDRDTFVKLLSSHSEQTLVRIANALEIVLPDETNLFALAIAWHFTLPVPRRRCVFPVHPLNVKEYLGTWNYYESWRWKQYLETRIERTCMHFEIPSESSETCRGYSSHALPITSLSLLETTKSSMSLHTFQRVLLQVSVDISVCTAVDRINWTGIGKDDILVLLPADAKQYRVCTVTKVSLEQSKRTWTCSLDPIQYERDAPTGGLGSLKHVRAVMYTSRRAPVSVNSVNKNLLPILLNENSSRESVLSLVHVPAYKPEELTCILETIDHSCRNLLYSPSLQFIESFLNSPQTALLHSEHRVVSLDERSKYSPLAIVDRLLLRRLELLSNLPTEFNLCSCSDAIVWSSTQTELSQETQLTISQLKELQALEILRSTDSRKDWVVSFYAKLVFGVPKHVERIKSLSFTNVLIHRSSMLSPIECLALFACPTLKNTVLFGDHSCGQSPNLFDMLATRESNETSVEEFTFPNSPISGMKYPSQLVKIDSDESEDCSEFAVGLYMYLRLAGHDSCNISLLVSEYAQFLQIHRLLNELCANNDRFGMPLRVEMISESSLGAVEPSRVCILVLSDTLRKDDEEVARELRAAFSTGSQGLYAIASESMLANVSGNVQSLLQGMTKSSFHAELLLDGDTYSVCSCLQLSSILHGQEESSKN